LLTRAEIGHIRIRSAGKGRSRSRGSGSSPSQHIICRTADPLRGSHIECTIELLAEVPIAASLGGIRPIPAQVERRRRRHSSGGDDGAQGDTVKDGPIVGLRDPRPDGPLDRGGFHGHSTAPAHCDMGPTGCDASMSKCDVPGSDRDASMSGCDVTSSGDTSMPNRDVPGSDGDTSMSDCDMTGHRATFT
jgi:hypothetical protein